MFITDGCDCTLTAVICFANNIIRTNGVAIKEFQLRIIKFYFKTPVFAGSRQKIKIGETNKTNIVTKLPVAYIANMKCKC